MKIVGQTWFNLVTLTCGSWSQGQHDLYFTIQWPCLISWRLFDVWTSYFRIMSQYNQTFDLKTNVGPYGLYFMVHWFCLISRRLFDVWTSYFGIMSQYDPAFDLKINLGNCDLYFMIHWFCLISWRLFDVWTSYFEVMSQYDLTFNLKINIGHCVLYFMVQWFCLIFPRLFEWWVSYFQIMRQYDSNFGLKKYGSTWPTCIFHSLVILLNLLHAEGSYIIDIACHWTFFSNITSFSYFLAHQTPDFFSIFQPIFAEPYHRTYVHQCQGLNTRLRQAISLFFGIVWGCFTISSNFLWKSALNPEIWAENSENFNKIGDVSDPGTQKQMLVMCSCGLRSCVYASRIFNKL